MKQIIRMRLNEWPHDVIYDSDLNLLLGKSGNALYSYVKRACADGILIRLKKGVFLIGNVRNGFVPNEYEVAPYLYSPSFVSGESALARHGWMRACSSITCVTSRRAKLFDTPIGRFRFMRVPKKSFYLGVQRIETKQGAYLIASPWRALADLIYTRRVRWQSVQDMGTSLGIMLKTVCTQEMETLEALAEQYPSKRVRYCLRALLQEVLEWGEGENEYDHYRATAARVCTDFTVR